ncbi:hypothetical protein DPMN_068011 [Dreissena polymorpha]|uniref:Ketosynthase family 3 (KS3) domain-containing protein n=2 Tax=Dreissena polymorpha TaxID=45954 RepID=A0A9D4BTZ2_DREPO|nr:hypothetical protein DPMN_068011 [Dreissena polymorpha]
MSGTDEIAIVGVGCRFPGADDLSGFWRVLVNGENHVTEVPADRWNVDHFYDPDENAPGKMYVKKAGFIHGVENWDRAFFGISEQEGIMMDPQQRLVLQCVHMAAEDGGFTRKDLAAIKTGVFIGCMTHDFDAQANEDACATGPYSVTGSHSSILSARVSYVYNLTGPALTIDTACSSSLVAIHLGAQALLSGDVDMMICGGVNCLLEPNLFVALCKANMLARDGQCKAFTDDADGYGRGEGCGIVILKRLKDAISDGNKVWGLIKTGTNQDGQYAKPISAPSSEQQEKLIQDVLRKYNIDKNNITVIEAHGTGTRIGDPIECKALGHTLGSNTKTKYLGSVKTNIGHLEAAAGVAGLIKVLLMMKHKTIVPSLWYNKANENKKLQLSSHGFVVPTQLEVWNEDQTTARMASLNSFGFGGTNAHAVIYDYINNTETAAEASACILPPIVVISAVNEETLKRNKKALLEKLKELDFNLRSLSFTSTCKRDIFQVREAHYAKDKQALIESLMHSHDFRRKFVANGQPPKVVFVFCGVGTVWQDMGNILLGDESFHAALKAIDTHLKPLTRWSIVTKFVQKSTDLISDPFVSHIGLFSYQVALSEMWKKFGVTADAVVGQSVGEVAAAYTAGYLNLESAVQVIFHRSRHLSSVNQGKMIVVQGVDLGKIELSCSEHKLEIAVEISKTSCTVSGEENAIALLKTEVKNNYQDVKIKDLTAACAYHSRFVETAAEQIQKELPSLFPESSVGVDHIPMISTVIGKQVEGPEICSNEYWKRNAREKVLFMSAIKTAVNPTQKNIFLEIGPRSVLTNHMDSIFSSEDPVICISSIAQDKESNTIANATCELFEHGVDINWINVIQTCCHMTEIPNQVLDRHNDLFMVGRQKCVYKVQT